MQAFFVLAVAMRLLGWDEKTGLRYFPTAHKKTATMGGLFFGVGKCFIVKHCRLLGCDFPISNPEVCAPRAGVGLTRF